MLFFCSGSGVAEWLLLRKVNANGGSRVYSLLSLVSYPKHVHFNFLTMDAEYWGVRMTHTPKQDHNNNLDSVTLNYLCPVSRPRIVRHNRAKRGENGIHERGYFYLCCLYRSQHMLGQQTESGPPKGARGPAIDVSELSGGRSRTSGTISQGACCRRFLR
jgi:hypothetical protein